MQTKLDRSNVEDIIPLTSMQEGMMFHYLMESDDAEYHQQISIDLVGDLSIDLMKKAWDFVISKNEILRTVYRWKNIAHPVQVILKKHSVEMSYYDLSCLPSSLKEEKLNGIRQTDLKNRINIEKETLRIALCKCSKSEYTMIISNHHILYDGWSNAIIIKELMSAYHAFYKGLKPRVPFKNKFSEYVKWIGSLDRIKQKKYWENYLTGAEQNDFLFSKANQSEIKNYECALQKDISDQIADFASENGLTVASLLYSAWAVVMQKLNDVDDIIFGITTSGRHHPIKGIENMVGLFINTIPLRVRINEEVTLIQLLKKVNQTMKDSQEFASTSLVDINKYAGIVDHSQLFNSLVVTRNYPLSRSDYQDGVLAVKQYSAIERTNYNLTLGITIQDIIELSFRYNCFPDEQLIIRIGQYFEQVISTMIVDKKRKLIDIDLLSEGERKQILYEFNDTCVDYPQDKTIQQLFEEQVERAPDHVALVFNEENMTYKELNIRSNQLARLLKELGVKPDDIIALMVERSFLMIIGILGILKSGGAYMPIDPNYPEERIKFMLEDSQSTILLTAGSQKADVEGQKELKGFSGQKIDLDDAKLYTGSAENLDSSNNPNDLAYVIYTSGSTGRPKGVMIENRSIINLLYDLERNYPLEKNGSYILKTTYTFDVSVPELFGGFISGEKLVILPPGDEKLPSEIIKTIHHHRVTHISFSPSMLSLFLDECKSGMEKEGFDINEKLSSLKYVLVAGEALRKEIVDSFYEIFKSAKLENLHGPTEATVYDTRYTTIVGEKNQSVPIGKPISNTKVYVTDKWGNLQPISIPGELCISGDGLARGYLNRPKLTREKFVPNPFIEGELMYRTGDLVRLLADGNIDFLGRIDHQVKIRGFRIELGEIENWILKFGNVKAAVVLAREDHTRDRGKYLCAYFVSKEEIPISELRQHLSKALPDYMIPSFFKQLERMPLTPNGKIDRKALPAIEVKSEVEYAAPRNEKEEIVCLVFKEILGIDSEISIDDNFFVLGGDSIKALRIVSKLRQNSFQTDVRNIIENKTPRKIGAGIERIKEFLIDQGEVVGEVALTPIQKDFILNGDEQMHHFNQSVMLESQVKIDEDKLRKVLNELVRHHDMLRATYQGERQEIKPYQENEGFDLYISDFDDVVDEEQLAKAITIASNEIQRSINLERGPLFKVGLFKTWVKDYLLFCIHHLVVDGVSWRILIEDLLMNYQLIEAGKEMSLPQKTNSFQEWSRALSRYLESERLQKEIPYWIKAEADIDDGNIPFNGKQTVVEIQNLTLDLSVERTSELMYRAGQAYYAELNDILLTSIARGIAKVAGNTTVSFNMEGHGREAIGEDVVIDRTVGWFTSMYPFVIKNINQSIEHDICHVKEMMRRVPNRGLGYGVLKSLGDHVLAGKMPTVTFNYLGEFAPNRQDERFVFSNQSRGDNIADTSTFRTAISIDSAIIEGKLTIIISYDVSKYAARFMNDLSLAINNEVNEVLDHCLRVEIAQHTPSDFGELRWGYEEFMVVQHKFIKQGYEIEHILPLTGMQSGMLFHKLLNPDASEYVIQTTFSIRGASVSEELLQQSFELLMKKHQVLRSNIVHKGISEPRLVVLKEKLMEFTVIDLSTDTTEKTWQEVYQQDVLRGFDLEEDSLMRFTLIKLSGEQYKLALSYHHIIMDGWCSTIVMNDFLTFYDHLSRGQSQVMVLNQLPKTNEYSDYIHHIRNRANETGKRYWQNLLAGYEGEGKIPPIGFTGQSENELDNEMKTSLTKAETIKLDKIAQTYGVTLNTIVEATWGILLQRYNGSQDVVFGKVVSGRNIDLPGIEEMVGLFINTIPIRVITKDRELTFGQLIIQLQEQALRSSEYDHHSLADIQELSGLGSSLIQTTLVFENYYTRELGQSQLNIHFEKTREETNYELSVAAYRTDQLMLSLMYHPAKYGKSEIKNILDKLKTVLRNVLENPEKKVSEITGITLEERNLILTAFNDTDAEYPREKTIHQLFEEQAKRTPENIAIEFKQESITYRELNIKANQLAKLLQELDVKADQIIGIMARRSLEMIIGILGILKSGGAYMPIDPDYPKQRIKFMLEDSAAKILLTQSGLSEQLEFAGKKIYLDKIKLNASEGENLALDVSPNHLAYVIYTSGSTGLPKGVMVEHQSVVNLCSDQINRFKLGVHERVLLIPSISFDASVEQIFITLLSGATLYPIDEEILLDSRQFGLFLQTKGITHMATIPSFLKNVDLASLNLNNLKRVILGGEVCPLSLISRLSENFECYNEYGPTEATVTSIIWRVDPEWIGTRIPIGKPLANYKAYIMDGNNELVAIGAFGELHIGGDGLARGYLNNSQLTKELFIPNPFIAGERIYRTGDLARWLPDGNIEFLGRLDQQAKIRGFRVELGEVESQILKLSTVKEAVVLAREDILCAYLVCSADISVTELKQQLSTTLPDYMIPSSFVKLEKMPLTPNGKIDRKALPELNSQTERLYVAPRNMTEAILVQIWSEVLDRERVGIYDNFFELGGHSLKATAVVSRIHKELNIILPLKELFRCPTISEISEYFSAAKTSVYASIEPVGSKEYYEASSAQKRMWLLQQLDHESTGYNMPGALVVKGNLARSRLEEAFLKLIKRHESLRTMFAMEEDVVVQKVARSVDFEIEYAQGRAEAIDEHIKAFIRPFDLSKAPLLRAGLITISPEQHYLLFDMHHIISDGISMAILTQEFMALYEGQELKEQRIGYKDFSQWQNEYLRSEKIKDQESYWLEQFAGEIPLLNLPLDYPRPTIQNFTGGNVSFKLEQELTEKLNDLAGVTGTTLYMVLLSAINILLSKYTGQTDIIIGSPIAGRPHADLEGIIGMFVNTLAMRSYPVGEKTYTEFLKEVKETALTAYENQDYQFEELVEKLELARHLNRNPLFDVMFVLQNMDTRELVIEGLSFSEYASEQVPAKFDLMFTATETDKGVLFNIEYGVSLFQRETIERLARHLHNLLNVIVAEQTIQLGKIDILSEAERYQLLCEFNNTYAEYPKDKTIHQLFGEQVKKAPEKTALVFGEDALTYQELNEKSNQVARALRKKGVKPDIIVGIMAERSFEMLIGIMGILKSGGAYMAIDPNYPEERIKLMIADSQVEILLTQSRLRDKIEFDGEKINLDERGLYTGNSENLSEANSPNDLAYVIYTSGSTGSPKGVMIEHRGVINLLYDMERNYPLAKDGAYLLKAPFTFDISITEIFGTLTFGGRLVILKPGYEKLPNEIINAVYENSVTHINFVPSVLTVFLEECKLNHEVNEKLQSLKYVLACGEILRKESVDSFYTLFKHLPLENLHGPTEVTVYDARYTTIANEQRQSVPIGKPISNCKVYLLDKENNLVPLGVFGELCISSDGLARGYLNQPELTEVKFVPNPFIKGERMYRTGDLARWLPDGNIEFLGRMDYQVKIRGFRVELGEIESQILKHSAVKEVVVLARDDILCAYLVSKKEISASELRQQLLTTLPDYMIPSFFVQLERMPLTLNGKVDRKSLPAPDDKIERSYVAPRNMTEAILAQIWSEVLGRERVGIYDNFFELGGHSLKATAVASRIHKELSVMLPLKELFRLPTISEVSEYLSAAKTSVYASIEPVGSKEYYEASSAQKRMWVLQQLDHENTGYNLPAVLVVNGNIGRSRLEEAFLRLIKRHESLRTMFAMEGDVIVQKVARRVEFEIEYAQGRPEAIDEHIKAFIRPFDLSKAPLLRAGLITISPEQHYLLFDMHHIIADGTSMAILTQEFMAFYEGQELKEQRIGYKDFSQWQNEYLRSEKIRDQESYWLEQFSGEIPLLNLPLDYPRPTMQNFTGGNVGFKIEQELTEKLNDLAQVTGTTLYMVLLSAISILLSKYTGQTDIIIGSPIAGRPHADLEGIIGMFVNTLAMRCYPVGEKTYTEFLKKIKETALTAYENQDYQFEELVEKLELARHLNRNPLFDVMFVLQNMEVRELVIEGLSFSEYKSDQVPAKFDLTFTAVETDEGVVFNIEYRRSMFKRETIERLSVHLLNLIEALIVNKSMLLRDIDILSEDERNKILYEFNNTYAEFPKDKTIHQLFEEQVKKTPEKTALVFGEETLTYRELNEKSNQVARLLREEGVKPDSIVGLMTEHSTLMIVGILGILKSGGAYLPVDPDYPVARIKFMIEDSRMEILLTQSWIGNKVMFVKETINLDEVNFGEGEISNLEANNNLNDLAYIMYTSGSTGTPKGVLIEHKSVIRLVKNPNYIELNHSSVILQTAPIAFDASTFEIWGALLNGGKLVLTSISVITNAAALKECITSEKVNTMWCTVALYNQLVQTDHDIFNGLQHLLIGGDKLSKNHVRLLKAHNDTINLINGYGPTENTTFTTTFEITKQHSTIPIGKPINNTQVYIMNGQQLSGIGALGELCIGGDGLARGYLNRPELTKELFVDNPFILGKRMYRTKDLARWLPDGNIEFLGRIDHQVKIRGFRIELGEIENQILKLDGVKEAVVLVRENVLGDHMNDKYLCAYLVSEAEITGSELRQQLSMTLPDYMIPSYFVQLEKIPLTANGKIDRKSLPEPERDLSEEYIAPRTAEEKIVAKAFEEILGARNVGVKESFLALGGDSIKAIRIVSKLREVGYELSVQDLIINSVVESISKKLKKRETKMQYEQGEVVGEFLLTPIQKWFFASRLVKPNHFNQAIMLKAKERINKEGIVAVLDAIIKHHDILRAVYHGGKQELLGYGKLMAYEMSEYNYIDDKLNEAELAEKIAAKNNELQASLNIETGPLTQVGLFRTEAADHLMVCIHHLAIDGISWRIFLEDLEVGYRQYLAGSKIRFPAKTASFKTWSEALYDYSASVELKQEIDYWRQVTKSLSNLPLMVTGDEGMGQISASLNIEETNKLLYQSGKAFGTEINDLLLSALGMAIQRLTGQRQVSVNLEGHGREVIHRKMDIDRTLGWFTSVFPINIEVIDDIKEMIIKTKEMLRKIPNKGLGYGVLKYLSEAKFEHEEVQISFNYFGSIDADTGVRDGLFRASEFNAGRTVSLENSKREILDINCIALEGKLTINIGYKRNKISDEDVKRFRAFFIEALKDVINVCIQQEEAVKTSSDFGLSDERMPQDELEEMLELF